MVKVAGIGAGGRVEVVGLNKFRQDLKRSTADADKQMTEANNKVAGVVIRGARALADTRQEKRAAATLAATSTGRAARVTGGGKGVAYFGGANFGAHINQRRIIKLKGKGQSKRGRSTVVRKGQRVKDVVGRIEAQSNPNTGRGVSVKRDKAGNVKVIRGWNQFRAAGGRPTRWRKGKDQFLYAAVRTMYPTIAREYQEALDRFTHDAFD
jgi:hypothetical protein